jgi:acyl carrier protein
MLNSIDLIELQVKIEDTFEMRFDPIEHDLPSIFKTVGSLDEFLKGLESYE